MKLTPKDAYNILDTLEEWSEHPDLGPKEMAKDDDGLDLERYEELKARLVAYVNHPLEVSHD
jgi:hypothetical protein